MHNIINILQCKEGTFPFPYLGLPLSINKLKIEDFSPMLQRIERRISGCSTLISYDGRLQLIKSVFSSLPTFFMSCLALPVGVIEQINKYLRRFLWRKIGQENQGPTLIAWAKVCKPQEQGGLGILDIDVRLPSSPLITMAIIASMHPSHPCTADYLPSLCSTASRTRTSMWVSLLAGSKLLLALRGDWEANWELMREIKIVLTI